jgi:hypothetical protein
MKKLLFITTMLLMAIVTSAQEMRAVDRNLTLNGSLIAYFKAEKPTEKNIIPCEEGTEWYLQNQRIGENNHITFWIQTSDGRRIENQYWHGNGVAIVLIKDEGNNYYHVFDNDFYYLKIAVWEDTHTLQLFTRIRE